MALVTDINLNVWFSHGNKDARRSWPLDIIVSAAELLAAVASFGVAAFSLKDWLPKKNLLKLTWCQITPKTRF